MIKCNVHGWQIMLTFIYIDYFEKKNPINCDLLKNFDQYINLN